MYAIFKSKLVQIGSGVGFYVHSSPGLRITIIFSVAVTVLFFILSLQTSAQAQSTNRSLEQRANTGLVYHGKLVKDGKVVVGPVTAQVKILSPEPSKCILWSETQTITLQNGAFAMELGYDSNRASSGAGSASQGAGSFREVFLNNPGLTISGA